MVAFGHEGQRKEERAAVVEPRVSPAFQHTEHGKGEKQLKKRVQLAIAGVMVKIHCLGGYHCAHGEQGSQRAIPAKPQPQNADHQPKAQGAEKAQPQQIIAEQAVAQRDDPEAQRRLAVVVVRFAVVRMDDIVSALEHFIGVLTVTQLVIVLQPGGGQPAEQKNACRQHQADKAEPVQQPGSLPVLKQRRLFFHESILFSENYGSYTSVQPSP